jgi:hypothetical protein
VMRRFIVCAAFVVALALPALASAEGPSSWASSASSGGAEATEVAGAQCGDGAVSGSFGYFGQYGQVHDLGINNPGSDERPGADGHKTGTSNSAVCGNRP